MTDLEAFTKAYIEAALWASSDEDGVPLDSNYTDNEIEPETLKEMKRDAAAFYNHYKDTIEEGGAGVVQAGHDFFLTRNGSGAGFWDGDWPEVIGKLLTEGAHSFGEYNLSALSDGPEGMVISLSDPGVPPYFEKGPFDWWPEV